MSALRRGFQINLVITGYFDGDGEKDVLPKK